MGKYINIIALLVFGVCSAQQTPVFAEYNYNPFIINSAHAGMLQTEEISLSNTGFLNSFEGSPKNLGFTARMPLRNENMGLGAGVIHDQIGVTTATSVFAAFSYRVPLNLDNDPYWKVQDPEGLSFGITAGVQKYQENLLDLGLGNDPLLAQNINANVPMVGAGVLLNYSKFYIGLSTPNLLGDRFASDDALDLQIPYYGYMGYRFYSSQFKNIMVTPSVLFKYENGAPIQTDINVAFTYNSVFELGAGYRTNSSVNLLAGVYLFESLRLIYSYNVASKNLTFGNTHGLILNFRFDRGFEGN
jgi:type IX secretion system PorP/SprF family membrane protein